MEDIKAKYAPPDWMMRSWGISTTVFLIIYFTMIVWGDGLSAYVDETTRMSISTNLTLIFLIAILWNIRESIPLTILMIKQIRHDIFIVPKEYEAETQRIRDEWLHAPPPPPKPRRQPKMKPVGEPVNLRQWVGQRSYAAGGYIYILKDIEISGYYKIGKTRVPYDRMKAFGVRLPFETDLMLDFLG